MRIFLAGFMLFCLVSCITPETRQEIGLCEREVAELTAKVEKAEKEGDPALPQLRGQLEAAKVRYLEAKQKGIEERIVSGASVGQKISTNLSPIAAIFLPLAGLVLSLAGEGFGAVKDKFSKPKVQ